MLSQTLPSAYCRAHLPSVDTIMLLETETGEQYETKYLPRHCRLSGGWSRFAMNMKLEEGDAVIFHLVEAAKFKVCTVDYYSVVYYVCNHSYFLLVMSRTIKLWNFDIKLAGLFQVFPTLIKQFRKANSFLHTVF